MSDGDEIRPPARLSELTQWQISKVSTLGSRLTARRMPLGGRADFAVLAALDEVGALSQADLGRRLGLDRNDVNGVINRLQSAGRVDRVADPSDRRRNTVSITESGGAHLEELQRHADDVQEELLHGLEPTERDRLRELLAKVLSDHGPQSA